MNILAKLFIGWGALILGGVVLLFVAATFGEAYGKGGWPSIGILATVLSAFPALFLGLWFKTR